MKRLVPRELWGDYPAQLAHFTRPKDDGCWEFTGFVNPSTGYGQLGRNLLAHRVAWEVSNGGPVPAGLVVDHTCHNNEDCHDDAACAHRRCVNPDHLEAVTFRTNVIRGVGATAVNAPKTHCANGHPFDEQNTYHHRGHRQCATCRARQNAISNAKARARRAAKPLS